MAHTETDVESLLPCKTSPRPRLLLVWSTADDAFQMTRAQEFANAATMLLPTLAIFLVCVAPPGNAPKANAPKANARALLFLAGSALHFPASCAYHVSAALNRLPDRIDNDLRRLDQTYAHAVAALFTIALVPLNVLGSLFAALSAAINLRGMVFIWDPATSNDGRRWRWLTASTLLPTLPLLARGELHFFATATAAVLIGGLPFIPIVNRHVFAGWGHALFHVVLALYAHALASSAANI